MKTFFAMIALIITLLVALIITPNPKEPTVTRVTVTIPTTTAQAPDTLGCATANVAVWCVYPVTNGNTTTGAWIVSDHASYGGVGRRLRWMEREADEESAAARHERVREIFQMATAAQAEACW